MFFFFFINMEYFLVEKKSHGLSIRQESLLFTVLLQHNYVNCAKGCIVSLNKILYMIKSLQVTNNVLFITIIGQQNTRHEKLYSLHSITSLWYARSADG